MKISINPQRSEWKALIQRPVFDASHLEKKVDKILKVIQQKGDRAIRKYTKEFDGVTVRKTLVSSKELKNAERSVSDELKQAIQCAKANIEVFHKAQIATPEIIETMPGVRCWRKSVAIDKVGLYIPGGSAPLFSTLLMLGIPAKLAGCKEIVLCSPPDKEGNLHPAILYTASLIGISKIFKIGGVQAIGAMAFGTETVPQVYKIFGPGNQYVTCAKQLVQKTGTAIDMPAGPSEVCVLADETADPDFIASDLLSQAEHGPDSQVFLVSTSEKLIQEVLQATQAQLENLPRKELAEKSLQNSQAVFIQNMSEAVELVNEYASEHLIICCKEAGNRADQITNAGSVFIGSYSPESAGDYASGTNHTLPTNGFARAYSGVSIDSFVKKITYQHLTQEGLHAIAHTVITMAETEGLQAHAEAIRVRLKNKV
jgi:histidinol dehydrogenase